MTLEYITRVTLPQPQRLSDSELSPSNGVTSPPRTVRKSLTHLEFVEGLVVRRVLHNFLVEEVESSPLKAKSNRQHKIHIFGHNFLL